MQEAEVRVGRLRVLNEEDAQTEATDPNVGMGRRMGRSWRSFKNEWGLRIGLEQWDVLGTVSRRRTHI